MSGSALHRCDSSVRRTGGIHLHHRRAHVGPADDRTRPRIARDVDQSISRIHLKVARIDSALPRAVDVGHELRRAGCGRVRQIDPEHLAVGAVDAVKRAAVDVDAADERDRQTARREIDQLRVIDDGVQERAGDRIITADFTKRAKLHNEVNVSIRTEVDVLDSALADECVRRGPHWQARRGACRTVEADDTISIAIDNVEVSVRTEGEHRQQRDTRRIREHGAEIHASLADLADVARAVVSDIPVAIGSEFHAVRHVTPVAIALAVAVPERVQQRGAEVAVRCVEHLDPVVIGRGHESFWHHVEQAEVDRVVRVGAARAVRSLVLSSSLMWS